MNNKNKRNEDFYEIFHSPKWGAATSLEEEIMENFRKELSQENPFSEKSLEEYGKKMIFIKGKMAGLASLWRARNEIIEKIRKREEADVGE